MIEILSTDILQTFCNLFFMVFACDFLGNVMYIFKGMAKV